MRRRSLFSGILATAAVCTVLLLLLNHRDRTGGKVRLREGTAIDSIVLSGKYDTVFLAQRDGEWLVLGEDVNPVTVANLLFAARNLQVVSVYNTPPAEAEGEPVLVRYFHKGRCRLSYHVEGKDGRFLMKPEGEKKYYRMELPGYANTDLADVFSTRPNHYRRHLLIDLLPSEIREVEVSRKGEEAFRFTMDDSGRFTCIFPGSGQTLAQEKLDDLSLRLLFSYFTNIRFEKKLEVPGRPSPDRFLATLRIASRSGEKHRLDIYSLPADGGTGDHIYKALVIHNEDPYPLVINYIYLDVLMRPLSAYYVDNG